MEYQAIMCIVNNGYTDNVMEVAKSLGAKGGTVIHAKGTVSKEAEKEFNITIQPDKEIVLIIVQKTLVDPILSALYDKVGTDTEAQGIAFSLPVDKVVGIK